MERIEKETRDELEKMLIFGIVIFMFVIRNPFFNIVNTLLNYTFSLFCCV
jgi:hypothetical protein